MNTTLFVISDLHLGGAPGFQMCSPNGRQALAEFVDYVSRQKQIGNQIHLVLNGDIVDFLAEPEFSSFTNSDDAAKLKLARIVVSTKPVWDALARLADSGCQLTLLLGNHDVELSFPQARQLLAETLGSHVHFIYDNQAFVYGPVLIEHGNRYDAWNVVSHDVLRAIRSAMSRKETPIDYVGPPGSQLVHQVMNPIKAKYPFVDLLKPENSSMLPILAVLEPAAMKSIPRLAALAAKSKRASFDADGIPLDRQNIAGSMSANVDAMVTYALRLAGLDDPQDLAAGGDSRGLLQRIDDAMSDATLNFQLDRLRDALRSFSASHRKAFDISAESDEYLVPATAAAARGFKIVIYGHTHLPKRVSVLSGTAWYLNTGTWADIIRVPEEVLSGDERAARGELKRFLLDLKNGDLLKWRVQMPTFAKVDLEDLQVKQFGLYEFRSGRPVEVS